MSTGEVPVGGVKSGFLAGSISKEEIVLPRLLKIIEKQNITK